MNYPPQIECRGVIDIETITIIVILADNICSKFPVRQALLSLLDNVAVVFRSQCEQ